MRGDISLRTPVTFPPCPRLPIPPALALPVLKKKQMNHEHQPIRHEAMLQSALQAACLPIATTNSQNAYRTMYTTCQTMALRVRVSYFAPCLALPTYFSCLMPACLHLAFLFHPISRKNITSATSSSY